MSIFALELIAKEKEEKTGKIDLGKCGLTELPEELFELTWLEELIISNIIWDYKNLEVVEGVNQELPNQLRKIPHRIYKLKNLKCLHFSGDWKFETWKVESIEPLQHLTQLQTLNLSGNKISDISFLQHLTQLQTLNLWGNEISDISFLQHLTQLQTLNLSGNKISDISFLQ